MKKYKRYIIYILDFWLIKKLAKLRVIINIYWILEYR